MEIIPKPRAAPPVAAVLPMVEPPGPTLPFRLDALSWSEELSLDGSLVPGKAVIVAALPFEKPAADGDRLRRSLDCLTAAVYYEARSESEAGQRAVAQVVLNRVRHYAFPSTICGVVFQGSSRRTGCQFTFTCDGSRHKRRDIAAWERARRFAEEALDGYVYAPVGLATHYHSLAVHPRWARKLTRIADVGFHRFYRWSGTAGAPSAFVRHTASPERLASAADTRLPRAGR